MPPHALVLTDDQIAAIDPADGPWPVRIAHRIFQYSPFTDDAGNPAGNAWARNGDDIELKNHADFVKGLRHQAFVDPRAVGPDPAPMGAGDFSARPDLVEFVNDHKVDEVLAAVGDDPDLAQLYLDAERQAKGDNARKGVLSGLQAVIDNYIDPATPADAPPLTLGDHAAGVIGGHAPGDGTETPQTEP